MLNNVWAVRSVGSFANVGDEWVHVMALLCTCVEEGVSMSQGDIFHCPGEQRRCHYPVGQTMSAT